MAIEILGVIFHIRKLFDRVSHDERDNNNHIYKSELKLLISQGINTKCPGWMALRHILLINSLLHGHKQVVAGIFTAKGAHRHPSSFR